MNARTSLRYASLVMIVVMVVSLVPGVFSMAGVTASQPARMKISAMRTYGTHLRPPQYDVLMDTLHQEGLPLNASPEEIQAAANQWLKKFAKGSETWVNASAQAAALKQEEDMATAFGKNATIVNPPIVPIEATVFGMAVDFGATETFTMPVAQADGSCLTETTTVVGPMQGLVPEPEPEDNESLWYPPSWTADVANYNKLIMGYEGAGRVRMDLTDPDDGLPGINLAGYTVQDYYDNVAGDGNVLINSSIEGWVTVPYSEGRYGADNCASGSHYGGAGTPVSQLVVDALQVFMADHPTYWNDPTFWPQFDSEGDGYLDTFWLFYAGEGQEAGGGALGTFALWSHSSDLRYNANYPDGFKVYEGDAGTTADDIYVGPYTMQPEIADVGVLSEEFGHNFFGLPDLYVTDAQGSVGNWATMEAGSWMGWLGGTTPATMPLWFKMIATGWNGTTYVPLNWASPYARRWWDDPAEDLTIGQIEKTPNGVLKGVRVNMPNFDEDVPNPLGSGLAPYSGTARNDTNIWLTRNIDIPGGATGLLSFAAYWDIEEDWDYGYVTINGTSIPDMDGVTTNTNPNGNNLGNGITGTGEQTLNFDLSSYAGQTVELGFRYKTDAAVTNFGWVIDDLTLDGTLIDDFETATEPGTFPGWTNTDPGWLLVPTSKSYTQYYLVEWRAKTHYDKMLKTAYVFNAYEPGKKIVDRIPYNIPAALVYFRNTKYSNTYAQRPNYADPPSFGSKYMLLIVDPNWKPLRLGETPADYLGYFNSRLSSYDAGLTLQPTEPFTISAYYGLPGEGPWFYPSKPAVTTFNDTLGYYGGFYYGDPCDPGYICYSNRDGSDVVPARDLYSTRITTFDYSPLYGLYGAGFSPSWLGSGNPGDDNVQWGVNIDLLSKAGDDAYNSTATLRFRNYSVDYLSVGFSQLTQDGFVGQFLAAVVNTGVEEAKDVEFEFIPDDYFHMTDVAVEGPIPFTTLSKDTKLSANAKHEAAKPEGVSLTFASIPPGEAMMVMITGLLDIDPVPSNTAWGTIIGNDGQVFRGPFWVAAQDLNNYIFIPIITKEE
jgi:immune inhibitor A